MLGTLQLNRRGIYCKGNQPRPKMVTQLFQEQKFHAPNGKAQACTEGALLFPLLGRGGGFPTMFLSSSQWVLIRFPKFQMCSRTFSPQHPTFYCICVGKCCRSFTQTGGPKGRSSILQIEPSILGSLHSFIFFE